MTKNKKKKEVKRNTDSIIYLKCNAFSIEISSTELTLKATCDMANNG